MEELFAPPILIAMMLFPVFVATCAAMAFGGALVACLVVRSIRLARANALGAFKSCAPPPPALGYVLAGVGALTIVPASLGLIGGLATVPLACANLLLGVWLIRLGGVLTEAPRANLLVAAAVVVTGVATILVLSIVSAPSKFKGLVLSFGFEPPMFRAAGVLAAIALVVAGCRACFQGLKPQRAKRGGKRWLIGLLAAGMMAGPIFGLGVGLRGCYKPSTVGFATR